MYEDLLPRIAKAKSRIETVDSLSKKFLSHVQANSEPRDVPTKIEFQGNVLIVKIFGHEAKSTSRIVTVGEDFYMEYLFSVNVGDSKYEVTRFYLGGGGLVYEDIETKNKICDYNNDYIASHICSRVAVGILESPVLSVSEKG